MWLSGVLVFLCAACSTSLPDQAQILGTLPQNTRAITIRSIPMKPGTVKNVEADMRDAPSLFARFLKQALTRKQPAWQVELLEGQTGTPDSDFFVNTEIVDIEGGNSAARFWIGLGAGAAHTTVQVSLVDRSGKELANARISEPTVCPIGFCLDDNEVVIRRDLEILAGNVADFIINPAEYQRQKEGR